MDPMVIKEAWWNKLTEIFLSGLDVWRTWGKTNTKHIQSCKERARGWGIHKRKQNGVKEPVWGKRWVFSSKKEWLESDWIPEDNALKGYLPKLSTIKPF